jgi:hypothetical protein
MEVNQRLQPIHDEAYQLFTEIEGRGVELEQVVTTAEQRLEGPVNKEIIQDFIEQEAMEKKKVEVAQAKLDTFEAELIR